MHLTRRQFVVTTATLTAGAVLPAQAQEPTLNFVLIGDWGRNGHDDQARVAAQMGASAQEMGSHFTVSVGDNFYESGVSSVEDAQWNSSFERIYTAASLQSPWKVILGNHDYRGNVQAQLDYSTKSHRWQMPARYFNEVQALPGGGSAEFFYLDTSPFIKKYLGSSVRIEGQDTAAQLRWLDARLGASTAEWKIVIGHHPIYSSVDPNDGADHDQPDLIARLDPVLRKHDVPIYISGHDHCLQAVEVEGVAYVVTGAGSQTYTPNGTVRGGFAAGAHGFMAVRLSAQNLDYGLVDMHGKTLFSQRITRA
ncbi:MAG: acid phosphatase [Acidocella sp. 20-63-7]|nr:MAG: acid phosphatase [Acidocella sp. 20-63-7]